MPRTNDTKAKMVASAALLLREEGIARTGFRDVVEHSGTPRGSIAHHFPDGKRQMVGEAVRYAGEIASDAMRRKATTPEEAIKLIFKMYRRALSNTAYAAGCPVGAVAQEGYNDPELRAAVSAVFDDWRSVLTDLLKDAGHRKPQAEALADLAIASMQGAIMLSRVDGTTTALDHVENQLLELVAV